MLGIEYCNGGFFGFLAVTQHTGICATAGIVLTRTDQRQQQEYAQCRMANFPVHFRLARAARSGNRFNDMMIDSKLLKPSSATPGKLRRRSTLGLGACLMTLAWLVPVAAPAADLNSLTPVCDGCHGINGVSVNHAVPTIAGQPFTLIEDNLLAFRDGDRACGETEFLQGDAATWLAAMCATVTPLEDDDITALAEHYEKQAFVPAQQLFDPVLAADGADLHQEANCELCHSEGGSESNGMSAILAGQWTPYLERSLLRIRAGERMGPKVMNRAIQKMSDADIAALLNFYASP